MRYSQPNRVFSRRPLLAALFVCALLALIACDSSNPVAPPGTVLQVNVNPTQIGLNGSSTITVTGFRPDGNPLNPGTQINLVTSLGSLASTTIEADANGRAITTLLADGRIGTATVTVTTASTDASATADVQIGENADTKPILSLNVSPNSLDVNETAEITARATQADGTPLGAGQRITLRTSLGSIDPSGGVLTDGGGEATATLLAGDEPGTARVSGFVGASDEATFDVTIGDGRPNLLISANPSIIDVGEVAEITVLARDSDNNPLGAGERVQFFTSLGSIPNAVDTDSNGEARANFEAGTRSGTADVQAVLRNSDPVTVQVTIQDVLSQLNLSANPSTVNRANQTTTVTLTIQALNAENDPVVGALVILDTEVGDLSRATVTTDQRGSATATITVDQQDIQGNFACTDDPQFAECFEVQAQSEGVVTRTFVGIVGAG